MQHSQLQSPYDALYKNLNLQVSQASTKEDAEEIARQLTMLHKTFGMVTQDLIKENSSVQVQDSPKNKVAQMIQAENKGQRSSQYEQKMDIQHSSFQQQKASNQMDSHSIYMKKKKQIVPIQIIDSQDEDVGDKKIVNIPQTCSQPRRESFFSYRGQNPSFYQAKTKSRLKQNKVNSQISISQEVSITESNEQNVFTFGNYSENKQSSIFEQMRKKIEIPIFHNQGSILKNKSYHNPNIIENEALLNVFQREEVQSSIFAPLINPIGLSSNKEENNTVASSEQKSEVFEMPNRIYDLLRRKLNSVVLQIMDDDE